MTSVPGVLLGLANAAESANNARGLAAFWHSSPPPPKTPAAFVLFVCLFVCVCVCVCVCVFVFFFSQNANIIC